jgi:hypothetical protein
MDHLPIWLRTLPLPSAPPSRRGAADPAPPWLQSAAGGDIAAGAVPDWLRDESASPPPQTSRGGDTDSVPGWLRELQQDIPPSNSGISSGDSQPNWLSELADSSARGSDSESGVRTDTPDWLRDMDASQGSGGTGATPGGKPKPFGATQWLDSLAGGGTAEPPAAPANPTKPPTPPTPPPAAPPSDTYSTTTSSRIRMPVGATDWLRSIGAAEDEPAPKAKAKEEPANPLEPGEEVPDWLRDISAEELANDMVVDLGPETPPAAKPISVFDPTMPGWLGSDDSLAIDRTAPADDWLAESESSSAAETMAADDMPDWLSGITPPTNRTQPPASPNWLAADSDDESSGPADDEDVPAWLRDVTGDATPPANPRRAIAPADDDDGPAWLRDVGAAEPPAAPPPAAPPAAPAARGETDDLAWLREPPAPTAPVDEPDDVPDWLRADVPPAPPRREATRATPSAADDDDVPAWLRSAPPADAPLAPPVDEVPTWLRDDVPPVPAPRREAAKLDEVPTWLRDDVPPAVSPAAAAPPAPVDDVPGWLRDAVPPPAAPAAPEAVPNWLRDATPLPPEPPAPAAQEDSMPAWLRGEDPLPQTNDIAPARADIPPWLASEAESASGSVGPGDAGLPSWLRGAAEEPPPAAPALRAAPEPPRTPPPPRAPAPPSRQSSSWLFADEEEVLPASGRGQPERSGMDLLGGADIPAWLRVPEPELPQSSAAGQTLDWLSRLSGQETDSEESLPALSAAAPLTPTLTRPTYVRTAEQVTAMALLERLHRTPYPEPVALPAPVAPTLWQRIGVDRVLYLVLALALLVGAAVPGLAGGLRTNTPSAPGALALHEAVAGLDADDVVLLAYEWDAQRSGELRPLEAAVTGHLIRNKVKLLLVSTDPSGTLISYDLREPMRAAGYNNENGVNFGGRDYVLLGYRPGGELALRGMAQDLRAVLRSDFQGLDATETILATNEDGSPRISTLNDLAMIVVMADQPQDVQAWMEQIHSKSRGVPIAFLLPSETQPLVQPYLRQANVLHLAGEQGALAYAGQNATSTEEALVIANQSGRLGLAIVVFLVLLAIGAAVNTVLQTRAVRRSAE